MGKNTEERKGYLHGQNDNGQTDSVTMGKQKWQRTWVVEDRSFWFKNQDYIIETVTAKINNYHH